MRAEFYRGLLERVGEDGFIELDLGEETPVHSDVPLNVSTPDAKLPEMSPAHRKRLGTAISQAKTTDDPRKAKFSNSEWGSMRRYAMEVLKIRPSLLSAYLSGELTTPTKVANAVKRDIGLPTNRKTWPGGLREED